MAEQNKKTQHDKRLREAVQRFADLYLKVIFAAENDAGWDGPTIIGRLMDFHGDLPQSSGFAGVDKMPERIRLIQNWPKQFRVAHKLMMQLTRNQREAVCVDRMYRGRHRMLSDTRSQRRVEVYWSDKRCAEALGISPENLRYRISQGYRNLEGMVAPAQSQSEAA